MPFSFRPNATHSRRALTLMMLLAVLMLAQLACKTFSGSADEPPELPPTPTQSQVDATPTQSEPDAAPTQATTLTEAAIPTEAPFPTEEPSGSIHNLACFGSSGNGLTCLGPDGWQVYTTEYSEIPSDYIDKIVVCGDRLIFPTSSEIGVFDGSRWSKLEDWGTGGADALACAPDGSIWAAHFQGVSYYNGSQWETTDTQTVTGSGVAHYEDMVVTPDGRVWVLTSDGVAMFDGSAWTMFSEGNGFNDNYFFDSLTVDPQGRPWVAFSQGVAVFDDGAWMVYKNSNIGSAEDIAVDSQGRVWVATFRNGLFILDNGNWSEYSEEMGSLSSDHVRSVATDALGRVWVGGTWGLQVIDDITWTTFRMSNSDLVDQDVYAIAVVGDGPALPEPVEEEAGSISGRLVYEDGIPLANTTIEICIETLGSTYTGETPCSEQPFMLSGQTDADGNFTITGVPSGFYILTVQTGPGSWAQLVGFTGVFSERVRVDPGQDSNIEDITVQMD